MQLLEISLEAILPQHFYAFGPADKVTNLLPMPLDKNSYCGPLAVATLKPRAPKM